MGKRFSELFVEAIHQRLGEGSYEGDFFFGWVRKKLRRAHCSPLCQCNLKRCYFSAGFAGNVTFPQGFSISISAMFGHFLYFILRKVERRAKTK